MQLPSSETGKPTKILAVYLSPCRPLIKSELIACLSVGLPVLMEGEPKAKDVDWISRLTTLTRKLLCDTLPTDTPPSTTARINPTPSPTALVQPPMS
jgi:hypothetical protein